MNYQPMPQQPQMQRIETKNNINHGLHVTSARRSSPCSRRHPSTSSLCRSSGATGPQHQMPPQAPAQGQYPNPYQR